MPSDLEKIGLEALLLMDQWSKGVAQYVGDLKKMEDGTEKTADETAKATEKQARRQEQALQKAGLAFTAAGAAGIALLTSITMVASRTEEMGVILDVTATNARRMAEAEEDLEKAAALTADAVNAQVAAVKALGITTQVASQLVAQMIRYNLDWTKSTELAALAQDAATFAAQDSSEALQGLIHGITTLNVRVLRNYGIMVSLDQEYKKFAEATGRVSTSLSATEKQTIAFNAVLAQGPNIAGAYEAAMDTASKQIRSLSRDTTEVAEAFGEHLTPALTGGVGALRDLLKWMKDLPDPVQATAVQIGIAASGLSAFVGAAALVVPKVKGMVTAFKELAIVSKLASAGLLGPVGLVVALAAVAAAAIIYAREVEKANREAAASILETSESYQDYVQDAEDAELGSYALSEGLYEVAKAAQAAGEGITALDLIEAQREMEQMLFVWESSIGPLDDLLQAIQTSESGLAIFGRQLRALAVEGDAATLAILADAESVRILGERGGITGPELEGLVEDITALAEASIDLAEATNASEEHEKRRLKTMHDGDKVVREFAEGMSDAERRTGKLTEKLIEQRMETQALTAAQKEYAAVAGDLVADAAEKMVDAEEKADEQREKAREDLLDAQEELEEEHAETVSDLLGEIADTDTDLKADLLKAEEEYQKQRAALADDAHDEILAAERELAQKQQDAWDDLQSKLGEIKRKGNEKVKDLDRDLGRDLEKLADDTAENEAAIWADYYAEIEALATAHGEKVASITETYAAKREAIEDKYRGEPEPETTDELREALQEELRLMEEQQAKTGVLDRQREHEILAALEELKAKELAALEAAETEERAAEDAAYEEEKALAESRRQEALDAEAAEYEGRKDQRQAQYDEALADLEIAQEREREAAKRDYGQKLADLDAALKAEKAAVDQRYKERLDSLDEQLGEEQTRLEDAAKAEKGRLQAQLTEEKQNFADRRQALDDHYDEQTTAIEDALVEEQKQIKEGLAEELREVIIALGKKSQAFRDAYADELEDLETYLADRLALERQYKQELESEFEMGSASRWMKRFGKDLRAGFEIGLGPSFGADVANALINAKEEVGEVEAKAPASPVGAGREQDREPVEAAEIDISAQLVKALETMGRQPVEAAEVDVSAQLVKALESLAGTMGQPVGQGGQASPAVQMVPMPATDLMGAMDAFQGGFGSLAPPQIQPAALPMPQMPQPGSSSESFNLELTANYAHQQSEASLRDDAALLMMQLRSRPRRAR